MTVGFASGTDTAHCTSGSNMACCTQQLAWSVVLYEPVLKNNLLVYAVGHTSTANILEMSKYLVHCTKVELRNIPLQICSVCRT